MPGVAEVDPAGGAGARVDPHQRRRRSTTVFTTSSALPSGVRSMPLAVKSGPCSQSPPSGTVATLAPGLAVPAERQPVELRVEGVREPGGARREDHVVHHRAVATDGEGLQRARPERTSTTRISRPTPPQTNSRRSLPVDFQSDAGWSGAETLADDAAAAGGQARPVDIAVGDRPEVGVRAAVRWRCPRAGSRSAGGNGSARSLSGGPAARAAPAPCGPRSAAPRRWRRPLPRTLSACEGTVAVPRRPSGATCLSTDPVTPSHGRRLRSLWPDCGVTSVFRTNCTGYPIQLDFKRSWRRRGGRARPGGSRVCPGADTDRGTTRTTHSPRTTRSTAPEGSGHSDDRPGTAQRQGPGTSGPGTRRSGIHLSRSRAGADRRRTARGPAARRHRRRTVGGRRRRLGPEHVPQRRTARAGTAVRQRGADCSPRCRRSPRDRPARRSTLPDLALFYRVRGGESRAQELRARIAALPEIDTAYVKPGAVPASVGGPRATAPTRAGGSRRARPSTPDFTGRQGYLRPAPEGVDAHWAWQRPGGSGQGVTVIDVEGAWQLGHEDLAAKLAGVVVGTPRPGPRLAQPRHRGHRRDRRRPRRVRDHRHRAGRGDRGRVVPGHRLGRARSTRRPTGSAPATSS